MFPFVENVKLTTLYGLPRFQGLTKLVQPLLISFSYLHPTVMEIVGWRAEVRDAELWNATQVADRRVKSDPLAGSDLATHQQRWIERVKAPGDRGMVCYEIASMLPESFAAVSHKLQSTSKVAR